MKRCNPLSFIAVKITIATFIAMNSNESALVLPSTYPGPAHQGDAGHPYNQYFPQLLRSAWPQERVSRTMHNAEWQPPATYVRKHNL